METKGLDNYIQKATENYKYLNTLDKLYLVMAHEIRAEMKKNRKNKNEKTKEVSYDIFQEQQRWEEGKVCS